MDFYKRLARPLLFKIDPETVHEFALALASKGLIKEQRTPEYTALEQELFGVKFKNPLGLAAGFDKNGIALAHWGAAGFGFVEIGTVTSQPQAGNPKPRLFRLSKEKALINRLGFNNIGARMVAENLSGARAQIPYGINIGKSYAASLEEAASDYLASFRILHGFGHYFTVNVSSPNTPGLRALQDKQRLSEILQAIRDVEPTLPLFVKVAPDLDPPALDDIVEIAFEKRVTGIIATNTTIAREGMSSAAAEGGGLSGLPLRGPASRVLTHLAKKSEGKLILIGVGGIFDGRDIYQKIALGAHLCQVYTGWVYEGPDMVPRSLEQLVKLMEAGGFKDLDALRGSALS